VIITTQKPLEEILNYLRPYRKIFIIGCGTCATECQTGGEKQVQEMKEKLEKEGFEVVGTGMIESPCDERLTRKFIRAQRKNGRALDDAEAVLVLACGAGVQVVAELLDKPVFPGLNTHFIGKVERIGRFYERCRACGECVLGETGGICPVTQCAKGLLNGPCGGMADGKCEVGGWTRPCAWVLIYERLKAMGRLDLFKKFRPPRDYSRKAGPGEVVWR